VRAEARAEDLTPLLLLVLAAAGPTPLEQAIAARVNAFDGVMGVCAVALATGETIAVNADQRFPTASAIKTALMVEVVHEIAGGRLQRDQQLVLNEAEKVGGSGVLQHLRAGGRWSVADLMYLMIALSDNTATNMLLGLVGARAVDERMAALGLHETRVYRPTFRDGRADVFPEEEREYGFGSSTPREMARLMELLARGQVESPALSSEMVALLEQQQSNDMIPRLLPEEGVVVAHKTGEDDEKRPDASGRAGAVRVDAGIVTMAKGRYAIAIFGRRGKDTRYSPDNEAVLAGAEISRKVYELFSR
jgi:beta-lactamase class A